jgi:signal transduction histidine kinase
MAKHSLRSRLTHIGRKLTPHHLSLKQRFYATTLLWLALLGAVAAVAIPTIVDLFLRQNSTEQLDLVYDDLLANLEWDAEGQLHLTGNVSDARYQQPYSGFYWRVAANDQVLRSRSLWDTDLTQHEDKSHNSRENVQASTYWFDDDDPIIGAKGEVLIILSKTITLVGDSAPVQVIVGIDEEPLELMVLKISSSIGFILFAVVLGLCAVLFIQLAWTFRPLKQLQNSVNDLEKGKADSVVGRYPKEIMPLVDDLNALLFHYQDLLERSRHHAGNLSHALKTPLTVLKQDASNLSPDVRAPILQSIAQLQTHIEYHLAQARVAGAKNILAVESNPSNVVDSLSMAFDKVYQQRDILLVNEVDDELRLAVDEQDLNEIIGNIIENGYKWATTQVRVSASKVGQHVIIKVEDDGPGVDEKQCQELATRGRRFDETTLGSGLGLSIAKVAAESYSGQVEFSRSQRGGLCVAVTLPCK